MSILTNLYQHSSELVDINQRDWKNSVQAQALVDLFTLLKKHVQNVKEPKRLGGKNVRNLLAFNFIVLCR